MEKTLIMPKKKITHQQMNNMNWRYRKAAPPKEEYPDLNGPVIVIKPKRAGS